MVEKYCFILDEETGLVQLGAGCSDEYYEEIGMVQRDVDQSDIDLQWYLSEKCPHKSEEEKFQEAKQNKYNENSDKCDKKLLSGHFTITVNNASASYYYNDNTKNDLNSSAIGFVSGVITEKQWTDEDGNTVKLSQENVAEMLLTLESWANPIWDKWGNYKKQINNCTTIEEVEAIVIDYDTTLVD